MENGFKFQFYRNFEEIYYDYRIYASSKRTAFVGFPPIKLTQKVKNLMIFVSFELPENFEILTSLYLTRASLDGANGGSIIAAHCAILSIYSFGPYRVNDPGAGNVPWVNHLNFRRKVWTWENGIFVGISVGIFGLWKSDPNSDLQVLKCSIFCDPDLRIHAIYKFWGHRKQTWIRRVKNPAMWKEFNFLWP